MKAGTAAQENDDNASELSMPGAWDTTPKGRPLSLPTPPMQAGPNSEDVDDSVPAFPALNSIQRSQSSGSGSQGSPERSPSIRVLGSDDDAISMPPPAFLPSHIVQSRSGLSPGESQQSSLSLPSQPSLLVPLSTTTVPANSNTKKKARARVALTPGHSPLDWARLKSSGEDLRVRVPAFSFLSAADQTFFFVLAFCNHVVVLHGDSSVEYRN